MLRVERANLTVEEFHRLTEQGALREDDRVELVEGRIVGSSR